METLREPCVRLSQVAFQDQSQFNPDSTDVTLRLKEVLDALGRTDGQLDLRTAEYVYFPIHHLLRKEVLSDRQTEYILKIISELVSRVWQKTLTLERAEQFIAVTIYLLSPDPPGAPIKAFLSKSNELHAAGFECLAALFTACDQSGLINAVRKSPAIPHILTVLLAGLENDTDAAAQTACLVCIDKVISLIMRGQADHLAMVAPGVLSKLVKFISPTNGSLRPKWHAQALAINALRSTLLGTFNDRDLGVDSKVRTAAWLRAAVDNIQQFLPSIEIILRHANRQEIINSIYEFVSSVLIACEKTLEKCLAGLINILMACSTQSLNLNVATTAATFLRTQCTTGLRRDALSQSYATAIEKLPRTLSSQDDEIPASALASIGKALQVVGTENAAESIISIIEDTLEFRLTTKIPDAASVVGPNVVAFKPQPTRDIMLGDLGVAEPLPYKTEVAIQKLLIEIGSRVGPTVLADIADNLRDNVGGQVMAMRQLWLATYLFRGAQLTRGSDIHYDFLEYCYASLARASSVGNQELAGHTILCVYLTGELAEYEGNEFKEYFVDVLSPLFTLLGNEREGVRSEAQRAISRIATATGYGSVLELVTDNKDYLVDGVFSQIGTLDITPATFGGLGALIYIGGTEIIPYIGDIFTTLFNLLDRYHAYSKLVSGIFMVFTTLARTVELPKAIKEAPASDRSSRLSSLEQLEAELTRKPKVDPEILADNGTLDDKIREVTEKEAQEVKEAEELARAMAGDDSPDDSDDEDLNEKDDIDEPDNGEEEDKWVAAVPESTYKILEQIGDRCDRMISHEAADIRLACIKLVSTLIPLLACNEKNFLPFVHRIWPQLIERLFDNEVFVVEAAFEAVGILTQHAGNFVAHRFDDLIPRISRVYADTLRKEWPQFSAERRKVVTISKTLSVVVESTDLKFESMETLIALFRPLFKRSDCQYLLDAFISKASDLVWLVLLDKPLYPASPGLTTVVSPYSTTAETRGIV